MTGALRHNRLEVGIDVVDLDRARRFVRSHRKRLSGFFLPDEYRGFLKSSKPALFFAYLFAVKEAVSKSLGIPIRHPAGFKDYRVSIRPGDIRIALSPPLKRRFGRPRFAVRLFELRDAVGALVTRTGV